ncbi:MAG: alpha/beta hydrolase [Firmicutes bacterium]|nr:alpha/beta hydrolase [Bacillota bacterium]MDY3092634.1 alpha/beta hydrolase [Erysipelotrichaceae bacterium]
MIKEKSFKSSSDSLNISYLESIPDGELKGVVQLVHGMAEHKERYMEFMEFLGKHGFASYINDHRGHGKSIKNEDDLGYFYDDKADYIVNDVYNLTRIIKSNHPGLPIYLFGHSMGSMVVRKYTSIHDDEINKLIVCGSPSKNSAVSLALVLSGIIGTFKGDHYRSTFINNLAFKGNDERFKSNLKNAWLSLNEENVVAYNKDKLCGFTFTVNGFINLFTLMRDTYDSNRYQMKNRKLDILFIAGEDDPVIISKDKFKKAVAFMKDLGYQNVNSILYPKLRHEILNEKEKQQVFDDVLEFIEK